MKNFFKVGALCLVMMLVLTGCAMKYEYGIKVDKDQTVSLEFLLAQDNDMIDAMLSMQGDSDGESKTYTDQERWAYVDSSSTEETYKDFEKTKYDKDNFKGYIYSVKLGKIEDLVAEGTDKINIDAISKDSKIFTKNGDVYSLNIQLSNEETSQMEQYASQVAFDMKMKVTLPNKAKSNNATSVEGNTYIWDLTKAKSIELSFDFKGGVNYLLIAGIACGVIVIGVCVVLFTKKNKKA